MLDQATLATEIPAAPAEVGLIEAAGLIPVLAGNLSLQALDGRLRIDDAIVRVWALAKIATAPIHLSQGMLSVAMALAPSSGFLRRRLLPKLLQTFRFELVAKLLQIEQDQAPEDARIGAQLIKASFANDFAQLVTLHERLYLATGDRQHLVDAMEIAKSRLGWRAAVAPHLRCLFMEEEQVATTALSLLRLLAKEGRQSEFSVLGGLLAPLESTRLCRTYVHTQTLLWEKQHARCLAFLEKSGMLESRGDTRAAFSGLAAMAAEGLGDYRRAARHYQIRNEIRKSEKFRPADYLAELEERAALDIGPLPKDSRTNHLIMTGFPRSGTTLLENVLASHPEIDTCEETSSLAGSVHTAYRVPTADDPRCTNLTLRAERHRELYYRNLSRHAKKAGARIVIDKTPILSANIRYLEKIFPEKRYIFSLRHPYDVVLSNFKQDFRANIAMAAFNDIHTACVLYDYVMRSWFTVFPGDTNRVRYVRYDDLVNDFERVVRGVLDFIGVAWTDEVTRFAEHSESRAVRTPSYANVRQGLSLGVQSSWQKFSFLFDKRSRALLDPWTEKFGYNSGPALPSA